VKAAVLSFQPSTGRSAGPYLPSAFSRTRAHTLISGRHVASSLSVLTPFATSTSAVYVSTAIKKGRIRLPIKTVYQDRWQKKEGVYKNSNLVLSIATGTGYTIRDESIIFRFQTSSVVVLLDTIFGTFILQCVKSRVLFVNHFQNIL